jgi:predicted acyl esterase
VGRVSAEFLVEADAVSHDLQATLSQVTPDGRALTLTQGYLRVADAKDGRVRIVAMRALCATVPAGAALRLSLQASSFPAFALNPGTGASVAEARLFDCRIVTLSFRGGVLDLPVEKAR